MKDHQTDFNFGAISNAVCCLYGSKTTTKDPTAVKMSFKSFQPIQLRSYKDM